MLNFDFLGVAIIGAGHGRPGAVATGGVHTLHDVDINILLTLTLSIFHCHLVFSRFLSGWIDKIQLNSVSMDSQISIFTHLENLAIRTFNSDLKLRLFFSLNLVGNGHGALLLGHATDGSTVSHDGSLLALDHCEVGFAFNDLISLVGWSLGS